MRHPIVLLFLLITFSATAQWDAKVGEAAAHIQQQHYEQAIELLREAVLHKDELSDKIAIRAFYNLGDALIRESQRQMSMKGDQVDPKYAGYIFEAANALGKARSLPDETQEFKKQIDLRVNTVFNSLLMSVVQLTNSAATVPQAERTPYFHELLRVCSAMIQLKPDHYMAFDYRGQAHLSLTDTAKAFSDLNNAIDLYEANPAEGPDAMAGYMYYRVALLEFHGYRNKRKALAVLDAGLARIKMDRQAIENATDLTDEDKRDLLEKFYATRKDLKLFKLELLLKLANATEAELKELDQGIKEFPDNVNVHLAYAQRVQTERPEVALEIYDQILKVDPKHVTTLFNAGVLYYNRAANLSERMAQEENPLRSDEALVYEFFKQAIPYFEKAHELGESNSRQILLNIGEVLDDKELIKKYQ